MVHLFFAHPPRRTLAPALVLVALFFAPAARGADTWTYPEPGIAHLHRTTSDPLSIEAVVVDLCDPSIDFRATRPSESPRRTSSWGSLVGARVAINADFYNTANYQPIGLAVGAGEYWPGTSDGTGWALVAAGSHGALDIRRAAEALGTSPEYWMREIVGGSPNCLESGVPQYDTASHYADRHPRSGIGVSADGEKLFLVVIDGRWTGVSIGATTQTLGQVLLDLGAWEGLNFDGGGSSTLWLAAEGVVNHPSDGSERTVANHFGVVRRQVPAGEPSRCCHPEDVAGATGTFDDVADAHWALEPIEALVAAGVTNGCSASPPYFCPGCRTTRAAAVAFLMRASGFDLTPPASATFSDVPTSHALFGEIEAAAREGITNGCGSGRFCPDDPTSRATLAVFAARTMGLSTAVPSSDPFADVAASDGAAGAIQSLVDACVVSGCAPGLFCPDRTATRAETAAVVARATGLVPTGCEPPPTDGGTPEPDAGTPEPDAGTPEPDAGTPEPDAGTPEPDAGTPEPDAGTPEPDAGTPEPDAGTPEPDAGLPGPDAGTPLPDGGSQASDGGDDPYDGAIQGGCACAAARDGGPGSAGGPGALTLAGVVALALWRGGRRRRTVPRG